MGERDIVDAVVNYYDGKLAAFGPTARGMDWKDQASQTKRFEQLLRALPVEPRSRRFTILDFGCGAGALLPFLRARGYDCAYTGYDRSERMVDAARRAHAGADGALFTSRWEDVGESEYAVASGVFNVRLEHGDDEWRAYVLRTLAAIDAKATAGWAINFLTGYADEDRKRADLHYADPAALFDWCKRTASRWVCLLHDYDLYEFTLGVTRSPR
jgi:SAM-dependent methyltransferase